MKRATVVINPISGAGRRAPGGAAEVELARRVLAEAGYEPSVVVTTGTGHATDAARAAVAQGAEFVVSWGGDGTMNEVARALAFGSTALALVPAGSGNGLGRDLGVPFDPAAALAVAAAGRRRRIDVGEANGQYFFNVAGVGLDARIARAFAEDSGRRGRLRYARVGAAAVWGYRARPYELRWPEGTAALSALFIAFANSRQYGSHGCIAPRASLDDGRLDLVVVADQSLPRLLSRVPAFFLGSLTPGAGVAMHAVTEVGVGVDGVGELHLDGEPRHFDGRLAVRVHPRALDVIVPDPR